MPTIDDIIALIRAHTGFKKVYPDTDINDDLGVYGDDFEELLVNYHEQILCRYGRLPVVLSLWRGGE